jgi:catechol 2,3-dioxygenase-like lactoylglutathione lyase family enzyme
MALLTPNTQYIFARDLVATRRWYTALIGFEPIEESHGLRYEFEASALSLSPSGDKGQYGLMISSIREARQRFRQAGIQGVEVTGLMRNSEADDFTSFRDPAGNLVLVADQSAAIKDS